MRNIFEWLFPHAPQKVEEQEVQTVKIGDIKGDINTLKLKYEVAHRGYKEEFERMRATEGKVSIFISTMGFLATIVVGVTTLLVRVEHIDFFILLLIVVTGFLAVYMVITIIFSVKAMRRQKISKIDPGSLPAVADETTQLKESIVDYINAVKLNMNKINRKVELSAMAQLYFMRAIVFLAVYVVALFIYAFVNSNIPIVDYYINFKTEILTWTIPVWFMCIISILIVISVVLSCIALYKVSNKNTNKTKS